MLNFKQQNLSEVVSWSDNVILQWSCVFKRQLKKKKSLLISFILNTTKYLNFIKYIHHSQYFWPCNPILIKIG